MAEEVDSGAGVTHEGDAAEKVDVDGKPSPTAGGENADVKDPSEMKSGKVEDEKPNLLVEDVKPSEKVEDVKPSEKVEDVKPSEKVEDVKPSEKVEDVKPSEKVEDEKPSTQVEVEKPKVKIEEEKPSGKAEGVEEAGKPSAQVEDEKPSTQVEGEKPEVKIEEGKANAKVEDEKPAADVVMDVIPQAKGEDQKLNAKQDLKADAKVEASAVNEHVARGEDLMETENANGGEENNADRAGDKSEIGKPDVEMTEVKTEEPSKATGSAADGGKEGQAENNEPRPSGEGTSNQLVRDGRNVETRNEDEILDNLRSMHELPASWRLLHIFSTAGLNIPEIHPTDLERFLIRAEEHLAELEEIHARVLGLGPASFNRWINKTKSVARNNFEYFDFLFTNGKIGLTKPSPRASHGFEEIDDGLCLRDLRSYVLLEPEIRCRTLHALLERQFSDLEGRVGDMARALEPDFLRLLPYGYDADLTTYWYFGDACRLYREPDLEHQERLEAQRRKEERRQSQKERASETPRERKRRKKVEFTPSKRPRRVTRSSLAAGIVDEEPEKQHAPEELVEDKTLEEDLPDGNATDIDIPAKSSENRKTCKHWELVAEGAIELRDFCNSLGDVRNPSEKSLVHRLRNVLAVEWEDIEKKSRREREKKERVAILEAEPTLHKRSARIHALEKRREQEMQIHLDKVVQEEELAEERQQRRVSLQQAEKERDRELKYLRLARSLTGVQPTAASSRPQRESSRRISNYRDGGQANLAVLEAQFSVRTERIVPEASVTNINEYNHSEEDSVPNRVLDRFRFIGQRGETSKLEYLDKDQSTVITGEGVLVPPEWSDNLPQMIEIRKVDEWCIDYSEDLSLWVKSSEGAWYKLERPANDYRWAFGSTRRKFEICARLFVLGSEYSAAELTYATVVDLLSYQYFNMRPNRESDILDVAAFVINQMETIKMDSVLQSEFMQRLRSHVLEKGRSGRQSRRIEEDDQVSMDESSEDQPLPRMSDESDEDFETDEHDPPVESTGRDDQSAQPATTDDNQEKNNVQMDEEKGRTNNNSAEVESSRLVDSTKKDVQGSLQGSGQHESQQEPQDPVRKPEVAPDNRKPDSEQAVPKVISVKESGDHNSPAAVKNSVVSSNDGEINHFDADPAKSTATADNPKPLANGTVDGVNGLDGKSAPS